MNPAIILNNIEFSYKDEKILMIPNLVIDQGEKIFIYGPSGSGKSTLLNIISGLLQPSKGELHVLDQQMSLLSQTARDRFRGQNIGYIFQSFNLIPYLTIYENILLPTKTSKKRFQHLSSPIDENIHSIVNTLGLSDFLDKRVTELSIGQQQRVAVARALLGTPQIVIADEPTSSLDEKSTEQFMKLLIQEHQNKKFTLIFVSHDQRLSKFFDREISLMDINKRERSYA